MVDCTLEEELCSSCHISLAVDRTGRVLCTNMEGGGAVPYGKVNSIVKVRNNITSMSVPLLSLSLSG